MPNARNLPHLCVQSSQYMNEKASPRQKKSSVDDRKKQRRRERLPVFSRNSTFSAFSSGDVRKLPFSSSAGLVPFFGRKRFSICIFGTPGRLLKTPRKQLQNAKCKNKRAVRALGCTSRGSERSLFGNLTCQNLRRRPSADLQAADNRRP